MLLSTNWRVPESLPGKRSSAPNIAEDVIYLVQGHDIRHPTVDRR
jgi:hypothetical protein